MPTYKQLIFSYIDPEMCDDYYEDSNVDVYEYASIVDEYVDNFPSRKSLAIYNENSSDILKGLQGDHVLQLEEIMDTYFPVQQSFLYSEDSLPVRFLISVYFLKQAAKFTDKYDPPFKTEYLKEFISKFVDISLLSYDKYIKIKHFLETF